MHKSARALCGLIMALLIPLAAVNSAPPAQSVVNLRLGMLIRAGTPADLGIQLAVSEINASGFRGADGNFYRLELVYPRTMPTDADSLRTTLDDFTISEVKAILGPVDNTLVIPGLEPLARASIPVLTLATADILTDVDVTNNIMRMRAAERYYSQAVANYLASTLGHTQIAIVQTNVEATEAVVAFEAALAGFSLAPVQKVQLVDATELAAQLPGLVAARPQSIMMWGAPEDVYTVYQEMQSSGWSGTFVYRQAQEAFLNNQLNPDQAEGMIGVGAWSFAMQTQLSRQFLLNYVSAYGRIPVDEAAAAYDMVYMLVGRMREAGVEMPALYEALLNTPPLFTIQGRFNPTTYQNGDFARNVVIYRLRRSGRTEVLARYENNELLPPDEQIVDTVSAGAVIGTPTFTPLPPTLTAAPSPTPSLVQVTVGIDNANIRSGPGDFYPVIGQAPNGTAFTVLGATADFDWFVIQYNGSIGWVFNNVVNVFDPGGLLNRLPIIDPQPTPIGGVTVTPAYALADVVIDSVSLTPQQPVPNQPFLMNISVRNAGTTATGAFTVGGTFPNGISTEAVINNLAPGEASIATMTVTSPQAGDFNLNLIADYKNFLIEGDTGEANNSFLIQYRVDYPVALTINNISIQVNAPFDLTGGLVDLQWTGAELLVMNGARINQLVGVSYDTLTGGTIDPLVITNTYGISANQIFAGMILGVITAEGQRVAIRIDGSEGSALALSYKVYSS